MNIELEYLQEKKADLLKQFEQLKANANSINGALQILEHLIERAKSEAVQVMTEAEMALKGQSNGKA